jgi:hypothetical protein
MLYTMVVAQNYPHKTKARPLTHFHSHTGTSNSLLGNVHPNKPELLTKKINNPGTEISAKFYISTAKTLVTAIHTNYVI